MAFTWGPHSLAGNSLFAKNNSASYCFQWAASTDFLPYISVVPTSPAFVDGNVNQWYSGGFPVFNLLGVSTQWSYLTEDQTIVRYYINVMNNGPNPVEFNFVYTNF
jgi:hypothetical protein